MANERISIKKISELTGYSVATVSRVINQNGRFSKETEEKIKKVIDEYGYIPDIAAKSLRTNNSRIIGVIVPSLTNELFSKIYAQIQKKLLARGYITVIYSTQEPETHGNAPISLLPILQALNVSGVIVLSIREKYESLESLNVPAVYIDCGEVEHRGPAAFIEYDMEQSGQLVAQKLVQCGCRNIAAMTNRLTPPECPYLTGVAKELTSNGQTLCCDSSLFQKDTSFQGTKELVWNALDAGVRFDALIAPKDGEAVAATFALRERGIRVPEEVRIVGCDDISIAVNTLLPLTTVHVDTERIGTLAVDCLADMMAQKDSPPQQHKVPLWLVERETT